MVLSSSGVAPRRVFRQVLFLAIFAGVIGLVTKDQIETRSSPMANLIEERMKEQARNKVLGLYPTGWRFGEYFWCGEPVDVRAGIFRNVAAFYDPAIAKGRLSMMAEELRWREGRWVLNNAVVVSGNRQQLFTEASPEKIGFSLGYDRHELFLVLRPDRVKTARELLGTPGARPWRILVQRFGSALLPLLCLLFALPRFIRWDERDTYIRWRKARI